MRITNRFIKYENTDDNLKDIVKIMVKLMINAFLTSSGRSVQKTSLGNLGTHIGVFVRVLQEINYLFQLNLSTNWLVD